MQDPHMLTAKLALEAGAEILVHSVMDFFEINDPGTEFLGDGLAESLISACHDCRM